MGALSANATGGATGVLAPYGLLSPAVKVIYDLDPHWASGFTYETLGCAGTTKLHSICSSASASIETASGDTWRTYRPFEVQTEFICTTMSRKPEELRALAQAELDIVLQKAIEMEFRNGTLAQAEPEELDEDENPKPRNRYLSDSGAVSLSGSPVKPRLGLALLEGALGTVGNGAQGLIHMPRSAAEALDLVGEGNVLRTKLDTPVVAGVGYTVTANETTVNLYGTGPVTVRVGGVNVTPDETYQSVDRKVNTARYVATAVAAVTWDSCVHFSVPVNLTLDY